jgi:hypothetical protein
VLKLLPPSTSSQMPTAAHGSQFFASAACPSPRHTGAKTKTKWGNKEQDLLEDVVAEFVARVPLEHRCMQEYAGDL